MSSLRSHPPARTPSRTSHAFRSNQNDHFSPFGSLAELNAATTQLAPPPPHGSMYAGSDRGRGTPQRAHRNNLPPPEEDDMGSFYGEEIDYGKVTSQLHPNDAYFPPGSNGGFQGSQQGGSQLPSRAGTGWGSRPESIRERAASPGQQPYGAYGTHHAFDYEDEFAPPNPPFRQWEGSRSGSVASHTQHTRQPSHQGSSQVPLQQWHGSHAGTAHHEHGHERDDVNYIPTIQVESPYPDIRQSRTPSPVPQAHHPVTRNRSSRASIHMEESLVHGDSGGHYQPDHRFDEPESIITRKKSSRSGPPKQRTSSRHASAAARSRSTVYSIGPHFDVDGDNVTMYVYLQWMDMLNERPCRFHITGVDGKPYSLEVDYSFTKMTHGTAKFRGAGLPHTEYRGRGKLVVEWEITFQDDDSSSD